MPYNSCQECFPEAEAIFSESRPHDPSSRPIFAAMLNWQWISSEAFEPNSEDALVVLGQDGMPSGELSGGSFAVFRHRVAASLLAQKEERLEGGEWIESEAERVRSWVVGVASKPGLDVDERLRVAAADAFSVAIRRKPSGPW